MLLSATVCPSASLKSVRGRQQVAHRKLVPCLTAINYSHCSIRSRQRLSQAHAPRFRANAVVRAAESTSLVITQPLGELAEPDYAALAGELAKDLLEQPWLLLLLVVAAAFAIPRVVNKFLVPGVSFILLAVALSHPLSTLSFLSFLVAFVNDHPLAASGALLAALAVAIGPSVLLAAALLSAAYLALAPGAAIRLPALLSPAADRIESARRGIDRIRSLPSYLTGGAFDFAPELSLERRPQSPRELAQRRVAAAVREAAAAESGRAKSSAEAASAAARAAPASSASSGPTAASAALSASDAASSSARSVPAAVVEMAPEKAEAAGAGAQKEQVSAAERRQARLQRLQKAQLEGRQLAAEALRAEADGEGDKVAAEQAAALRVQAELQRVLAAERGRQKQ